MDHDAAVWVCVPYCGGCDGVDRPPDEGAGFHSRFFFLISLLMKELGFTAGFFFLIDLLMKELGMTACTWEMLAPTCMLP